MLELLASHISEDSPLSFLRVFGYITVRAGLALVCAFLFCVIFGRPLIERLKSLQALQPIRQSSGENARSLDQMHGSKRNTPTMGGLLMIGALALCVIVFSDWDSKVLWLAVFAGAGCSAVGFLDDYLKVVKKHHGGLHSRYKLLLQAILGMAFSAAFMYLMPDVVSYRIDATGETMAGPEFLLIPFFKNLVLPLGIFYALFATLLLMGMSNAVNLTDGQDGLAAGVMISSTICFAVVAYLVGRSDATNYLFVPHVRGAGELAVLLSALCGACFGFLWWNSHPAQVFMGDTGSMMLGGVLGSVALLIKQEVLLLVVGGIFVAEALSVIIQVGSYKLRKKRVFEMAPLHHHFERIGIPESKVTARFWIVSALLALAGLVTLKFR
jgi:phospho-N-acetylmuramoyl-pentapeptide-transferase